MRRGILPFKIGEPVYYAQLKTPAGIPPTARVLPGIFFGASTRPFTSRVKCDHAAFPIDAPTQWISRDVIEATGMLYERIRMAVQEHSTAIHQLHDAANAFERTLLIQWVAHPPGDVRK